MLVIVVFSFLSYLRPSFLHSVHDNLPQYHTLQDMGYTPDFVQVAVAPFVKDIKAKGKQLLCAYCLLIVCDILD